MDRPIKALKILFYVLLGIWTLPGVGGALIAVRPEPWVFGINLAISHGLQFGKDIIYNYGPFAYLHMPAFFNDYRWIVALLFGHFIHVFFFVALAIFCERLKLKWPAYLMLFITLIYMTQYIGESKAIIASSLLLYLVSIGSFNDRVGRFLVIFISCIFAILAIDKYTAIFSSLVVIISFGLASYLIRGRGKAIADCSTALLAYAGFFLFFWVLAGQSLLNIPSFLFYGFQVAIGYNEAMACDGESAIQIYGGLLLFYSLIPIFLYAIKNKISNITAFLLFFLPVAFLIFKHGFVRHDAHVFLFFSFYTVISALLFLMLSKDSSFKGLRRAAFVLFLLSIIILQDAPHSSDKMNLPLTIPGYKLALKLLYDSGARENLIIDYKRKIIRKFPINAVQLKYLRQGAIDMIPEDISVTYAYGLKWQPRFVLQTYSAYTGKLDIKDSRSVEEKGPLNILYDYKSIDNKYPAWDEPATFRAILDNYSYIDMAGKLVILRRTQRRAMNTRIIETRTYKLWDAINVPKVGGDLYADIEVKYSIIGKLISLFYKPSPLFVTFALSDGTSPGSYRFIPGTSGDGVFIGNYIGNRYDLARLFQGGASQLKKIRALVFTSKERYLYSRIIVRFYERHK